MKKGKVIWLTGLSGSGKTTLANELSKKFFNCGINNYILDGDVLRKGLCSDLGLSSEDRNENIRRVSEVALLLADAGVVSICAFISPYEKARKDARKRAEEKGLDFFEIYIKCDINICKKRDPKGLYAKFNDGKISGMTGIDAPYEVPKDPDIVICTENYSIEICAEDIIKVCLLGG